MKHEVTQNTFYVFVALLQMSPEILFCILMDNVLIQPIRLTLLNVPIYLFHLYVFFPSFRLILQK